MLPDYPTRTRGKPKVGEPIWEVAHNFPYQGNWTEADYLSLQTSRFIEFDNGNLEFLPMPTMQHQDIVAFIYELLKQFVTRFNLGKVYFAPVPVRLWSGKYREPDILFITHAHLKGTDKYPQKADLVVEVISGGPEDRQRDLVTKRQEYAQAGIPEYWIVDPQEEKIIVLTLAGESYREHGIFTPGQAATSVLLDGFGVEVTAVFAAAQA